MSTQQIDFSGITIINFNGADLDRFVLAETPAAQSSSGTAIAEREMWRRVWVVDTTTTEYWTDPVYSTGQQFNMTHETTKGFWGVQCDTPNNTKDPCTAGEATTADWQNAGSPCGYYWQSTSASVAAAMPGGFPDCPGGVGEYSWSNVAQCPWTMHRKCGYYTSYTYVSTAGYWTTTTVNNDHYEYFY